MEVKVLPPLFSPPFGHVMAKETPTNTGGEGGEGGEFRVRVRDDSHSELVLMNQQKRNSHEGPGPKMELTLSPEKKEEEEEPPVQPENLCLEPQDRTGRRTITTPD